MKLFGTDGIRGKAGAPPLDPRDRAAGRARRSSRALERPAGSPLRILIGRDTRESGIWIEQALAADSRASAARSSSGRHHADACRRLPHTDRRVRRRCRDLGVAQSVRGQRHQDFLGTRREARRGLRGGRSKASWPATWEVRRASRDDRIRSTDLGRHYVAHLRQILPIGGSLAGSRIVVDCANGATTPIAPDAVSIAGLRGRRDWRTSRRPQHQPSLRIDASRAAAGHGARNRCAAGHCLRWRRRSRAVRRSRTARIVDGDALLLIAADAPAAARRAAAARRSWPR